MADIVATVEENLITFTATGVITADEVIATAAVYYVSNPRFIVWDLTNASMANMPLHDIKRIAVTLKKYSEKRQSGKTAFVSCQNVDFGLFRMYSSFAEIENVRATFSVFRTLKSARAWLFESEHDKNAYPLLK